MNRNQHIDAVRGFAIILVVIGHVLQFICIPNSFDNFFPWRWIYSFHMPLFMFISGYLSYQKNRMIDISWIRKKFLHLIVPFVVWLILNYFIQSPSVSLFDKIHTVFLYPDNGGLWFLLVLFYNFLCLFLSYFLKKQSIAYLGMIVTVLSINFPILISETIKKENI